MGFLLTKKYIYNQYPKKIYNLVLKKINIGINKKIFVSNIIRVLMIKEYVIRIELYYFFIYKLSS